MKSNDPFVILINMLNFIAKKHNCRIDVDLLTYKISLLGPSEEMKNMDVEIALFFEKNKSRRLNW